jgi:hypothetical protein
MGEARSAEPDQQPKLMAWNTTVTADNTGPKGRNGRRWLHQVRRIRHGTGADVTPPALGADGGRTFLMSFGRF